MGGPARGMPATGNAQGVKTSGPGSSQSVIMTGQQQQKPETPAGLLDAVSEIQQFWVIEKTGQDLPPDFLTIKGSITFMMIGARSGFMEGVIFSLLIPIVLTFSTTSMMHIFKIKTDWFFQLLLYLTAFSPVAFNTLLCCYLGKFYIGNLTKRAANCLMNGRSVALLFKGFLVFFIFYFLHRWITPDKVAEFVHKLGATPEAKQMIYELIMEFNMRLPDAGMFMVATAIIAAATPFLVVYWQDHYRRAKVEKALRALEDA